MAATVVLPMLTSEPVELKLVGLLVAKKKPAEEEKVVVMPGKLICAGKPIPSTGEANYHWHREYSLRLPTDLAACWLTKVFLNYTYR